MNIKLILLLILAFMYYEVSGQTFKVIIPNGEEIPITSKTLNVVNTSLPSISISVSNGTPPYIIKHNTTILGTVSSNNTPLKLEASSIGLDDFLGRELTITKGDGTIQNSFTISQSENVAPGSGSLGKNPTATTTNTKRISSIEYLAYLYNPSIRKGTKMGIVLDDGAPNTAYSGSEYTHIFYDFMGNLIFGTVPQGIANRSYVVHVVYPIKVTDIGKIGYSIGQTGGSFSSELFFRNVEGITELALQTEEPVIWEHQEFLLGTATNDISYELVRREVKNDGSIKSNVITQATINMSPVYHGSFDIGLLRTSLENPTYTLVSSGLDQDITVVKSSDAGRRGIVTAMATLYTSPIIVAKHLLGIGKRKPAYYNLTGRNFLDDHTLLERIYPAVGLSISQDALENIFYGVNWEIARGGSLFVGWHYGKVNTFTTGNEKFEFLVTPVSQTEFDINQNQEWKTAFAVGINLDLLIITNLLSAGGG